MLFAQIKLNQIKTTELDMNRLNRTNASRCSGSQLAPLSFVPALWMVSLLAIFATSFTSPLVAQDWASFRGPQGNAVAEGANLPIEISDEKNLAWKVELPGRGPSGPIVVGDRVFVTCSGGAKDDQLYVVCFDKQSGDKIWQRRFWATGRCFCHPLSANAAPTACSDGESIFAFYSSNDLFCLDLEGNLKWCRGLAVDHPKAGHDTGMSSSPAVHGDIVVCQVENQGDSFATGINKQTGETVWEISRDKDASWASPVIFDTANGAMCLLQAGARATVIALATGEKIWEKEGRGNPIPTATVDGQRLYIPIDGLTVVKFGEEGDDFQELYTSTKLAAGSPSNIVYQGRVYTFGRGGIVTCADANSGDQVWKSRVGGQHWTTPLLANNHLYFFDQEGTVSVMKVDGDVEDDKERVVYTHSFEGEVFLGSPAVSENALFMRSDKFLYKFATDPTQGGEG